MAYVVMADGGTLSESSVGPLGRNYIVMLIVMAYIGMAYTVMAYVVMVDG